MITTGTNIFGFLLYVFLGALNTVLDLLNFLFHTSLNLILLIYTLSG